MWAPLSKQRMKLHQSLVLYLKNMGLCAIVHKYSRNIRNLFLSAAKFGCKISYVLITHINSSQIANLLILCITDALLEIF